MDTNELLGLEALGGAEPREFIRWAERRLTEGSDSEALIRLAGLDLEHPVDAVEVHRFFHRALDELSFEIPSRADSLRAYADHLVRMIVGGELDPLTTARRLGELYAATDYRDRLIALWFEFQEDLALLDDAGPVFNSGLTADNATEFGRRLASQYLDLGSRELPEAFWGSVICPRCGHFGRPREAAAFFRWIPLWIRALIFRSPPILQWFCSNCSASDVLPMSDLEGRDRWLNRN